MFSGKKLLLLGFIIVLLVAIPVTMYLVQQQQQTKSKAAPATILSVVDSATGTPSKTMNAGESATFNIMVDPGTNQVSFVKFTLTYDATKLEVKNGGFKPNAQVFPSILQGPTYSTGAVSVTMSVGGSINKVIRTPVTAGTLTVTAIDPEAGGTTEINFGTPQVLSIGATDTFNENVFSSANPATITIGGGGGTTTTTINNTTTTTTIDDGGTDDGNDDNDGGTDDGNDDNDGGTDDGGTTNITPSCESLTLDNSSTGTLPYALMFTATGSDSDGTINKVTFNFGDGQVQDVTDGSGTGSISAQISHTYNTAGNFTATAIVTDDQGGVSTTNSCSQSIVINAAVVASPTAVPTTAPTMAPGPGDTIVTYGVIGAILSIVGVLLLFAL